MTNEERIEALEKKYLLVYEGLFAIRKMMEVQDERLMNLETFMLRATGQQPNPYVGVPPSDL